MRCPSCLRDMEPCELAGNYGRSLDVDVCHACRALWFDGHESLQLTAGSILKLFTMIHDGRDVARAPLSPTMDCPRCRRRLVETIDQQRSTRFTYSSCPARHGRFITFYHFLREKNFVRGLAPAEMHALKASIRTVHCSNCGAPVDLEKSDACAFCRSPLAVIDTSQVANVLRELQAAEEARARIPATLPMDLLVARLKTEHAFANQNESNGVARAGHGDGLLEAGVGALVEAIRHTLRGD